jgi:hypothetical protein
MLGLVNAAAVAALHTLHGFTALADVLASWASGMLMALVCLYV